MNWNNCEGYVGRDAEYVEALKVDFAKVDMGAGILVRSVVTRCPEDRHLAFIIVQFRSSHSPRGVPGP